MAISYAEHTIDMNLNEQTWTLTGEKEFSEITLNNPTLSIAGFNYDAKKDTFTITVEATEGEGVFKHSRTFEYQLSSDEKQLILNSANKAITSLFSIPKGK